MFLPQRPELAHLVRYGRETLSAQVERLEADAVRQPAGEGGVYRGERRER